MSGAVVAAGIGGVLALIAFLLEEHRSDNPMMPLEIFASRQFSAANLVTFAVYAALGGFFFLFVAFLQISLGYSPIAAGAASLPVTALMLALSARSGALAQRIGARIPLTVGPLVIAVALLLMTRLEPGDSYLRQRPTARDHLRPASRWSWRRSPPRFWPPPMLVTPGSPPESTTRSHGSRACWRSPSCPCIGGITGDLFYSRRR